MLSEIKFILTENEKVIVTVVKETKTEHSNLLKSLQDFQQRANAALTKIIEEDRDQHEDEGDSDMIDDEDSSENDDEDGTGGSPRKKKR